jgi:hydrogenase maturation protease
LSGRILVAGIGNIFLGDDGFGVEVVRQLAQHDLPEGVEVVDFGIRGLDLTYALLEDYDAVIIVDLAPRGGDPGTLYLIEPTVDGEAVLDTHGMDPVKVLNMAREMGARATRTYVVACEPQRVVEAEADPDVVVALSEPVQEAVPEAVEMLLSLIEEINASIAMINASGVEIGVER